MFVMDYAKLMRPIHRLVRNDVTPDSNVSAFWTRRLPKADPNYETEESRKRRRAISIKGGKYRTGSRTPVGFTVLDATPVSAPTNDYTNDHTNHNGQFDFMDQNAERGAANAALAAQSSRTGC